MSIPPNKACAPADGSDGLGVLTGTPPPRSPAGAWGGRQLHTAQMHPGRQARTGRADPLPTAAGSTAAGIPRRCLWWATRHTQGPPRPPPSPAPRSGVGAPAAFSLGAHLYNPLCNPHPTTGTGRLCLFCVHPPRPRLLLYHRDTVMCEAPIPTSLEDKCMDVTLQSWDRRGAC